MKPPPKLDRLIRLAVRNHTPEELALGWLRYETVRKLSPYAFAALCNLALAEGECFDSLVTEAIDEWTDPLSCHVVEKPIDIGRGV